VTKRSIFILSAVSLILLSAAGLAIAQRVPVAQETYIGEPDLAAVESQLAELDKRQDQDSVSADLNPNLSRAAAPPLTALVVSWVYSTRIGWEQIRTGQLATVSDHGGTQLRVTTDELGYGSNPIAKMLGATLPAYTSQTICRNFSGVLVTPCSAGQTVVGWRRIWKLDGTQSGNFTYQNTSINYPFNRMSTSLTIR